METFCIEVLGCKVRYVSDKPLLDYFIKHKDFMEFYDASIIANSDDVKYTVEYHDNKDISKPIVVTDQKMIVNYPGSELTESNLLYLGFSFLEKQFGEMGVCSCHSACVVKDGEATLLIGEAGAGKTSLAINLCQQYGYSLLSNDMTLIGEDDGYIYACGGTKFVNLRLLSVKSNMPSLLYLFQNDNKDLWTNKVSVMANNIGIEEEYAITPIKNILFVHIDARDKFKVANGDSWRNNFLLYQNVSAHIRGTASTFVNKKGYPIGYIPSFETEDTYNRRMKLINSINVSPNYHYVSGSLGEVLEYIDSLSREKDEKRLEKK